MILRKVLILVGCLFIMAFNLPIKLQKKVDKVVRSTFDIEAYTLNHKTFSTEITSELPSDFSKDSFFELKSDNELIGYAYISKAPSKTDQFDYLVVFDTDLIIKKSKVLAYREDYGSEIGSKRWLKQFIGKTSSDELIYGDNIAAISGATISVKSMTRAVNNVLKSIGILQQKGAL